MISKNEQTTHQHQTFLQHVFAAQLHCAGMTLLCLSPRLCHEGGQRSLNRANPLCAALTSWSKVSLCNTGLTWPSNATPETQTGSDGEVAKEPGGSRRGAKIKILAAEEQSYTKVSQERSSPT